MFIVLPLSHQTYTLFIKNINIVHQKNDFGILIESHFRATAHGKGPCDGSGGNLKRLAAKASLQRSTKHPNLTAQDLFKWAKENLKETVILSSSTDAHTEITKELRTRFSESITIPGTLKYHAFISNENGQLQLKKFSFATKIKLFPKKAVKPAVKKNTKKTQKSKKETNNLDYFEL